MDITELLENYQPDKAQVETLADVKLCLLVGISGAGKDTTKRRLLSTGRYFNFISYTTRAPRENDGIMEKDGEDYFFITRDKARDMILRGEFIEVKEYAGNIYGTGFAGLQMAHNEHKIALNDVEVQGVGEYKSLLPQTIAIFILPPSYGEWRRRMASRYAIEAELESVWPARREAALRELEHALKVPYYHFVINDDLDASIEIIEKIASGGDIFHRKDDEARLLARDILEQIKAN